MKIAIIGTGNVGATLGKRWQHLGYDIVWGSRSPEKHPNLSPVLPIEQAITASDIVVLAIPWAAVEPVTTSFSSWAGKIVIDATNPIAPGFQLDLGTTTSGAEQVATWATEAKVVKAFNTTGWENMDNPQYGDHNAVMFICGDDAEAKLSVSDLTSALGFEIADVGGLSTARFLEPLAMVWIHLAIRQGWGRDFALGILKR